MGFLQGEVEACEKRSYPALFSFTNIRYFSAFFQSMSVLTVPFKLLQPQNHLSFPKLPAAGNIKIHKFNKKF